MLTAEDGRQRTDCFLPLAIGIGRGTALLQPLAVAAMGGLALAAVSSLWIAPLRSAALMRFGRAAAE